MTPLANTEPGALAGSVKPNDTSIRDVPALSFRASFQPSTVKDEDRTAEVVWTTGARVLRGGIFTDPFFEELSLDPSHVRMGRLNNGAPLLASHNAHDLSAVVGVVESARLEQGRGVATVRFAKAEDDPEAEKVFRKVKDGILANVSVGYRVHKMEETEDMVGKFPVMRAVDWEPYEISVVPMGADDAAGFRNAPNATNPCAFVTTQERAMADEKKIETPTVNPVEEAARAAAVARIEDAKMTAAARERIAQEAAAKERERVSAIRATVLRHLDGARGEALVEEYVSKNVPIEAVRAAVLDILAGEDEANAISGHSRFEAGDDKRDKAIRGMAASIYERAGQTETIAAAKNVRRLASSFRDVETDPGEFRGWRLFDLARHSLELRGVSTKGLHGEALVKRALEFRGDAGFNTTSDFAILLETAVNKVFLGRYATIPVSWPQWCARKSVQDFRTTTFYRPGTFGKLDSMTEAGEFKHKNISDGAKATLTPATKGNIIGITRRAIVNDDLGVFRDLASGLGEAAALTVESDAWAMFSTGLGVAAPDGTALFDAAHSNIGDTGAMSVATLDSMRAKMSLQKDASGNAYLSVRPSLLLVPVELAGTAKVFVTSASDPTAQKSSGVANMVNGLFPGGIVDSPYLSALSSKRVYALADPSVMPVFAVGFIDGQEAPRIDSEQSFNYDGLQMRVVLDYGTAVLDYRGAVTCAGE